MRKCLASLGLSLAMVAFAALATNVYRWTDSAGVVHYGDKPPSRDARPVELPPLQTFRPQTPLVTTAPAAPSGDAAVTETPPSLVITAPKAEATIRDPEGHVPVSVAVVLRPGEGLIYLLDGQPQNAAPTPSTAWLLEGVERGEHHVSVKLVNAQGKILAESSDVTIYLMPPSLRRHNP